MLQSLDILIQKLVGCLEAERDDIAAAYLFGSQARGTASTGSDIDVAVLLKNAPPQNLAGLLFPLEESLAQSAGGLVQLVVLNTAPVDLVREVMLHGKLILERNRATRVRFEVRARRDFFDLEPHLRRYRRLDPFPRISCD